MIIDVHGHVTAPNELEKWKERLLDGERADIEITDEQIEAALNRSWFGGKSHLGRLEEAGTDVQLISPRPASCPHWSRSDYPIRRFIEQTNDVIARQCQLHPNLFRGIAGLPQRAGVSPKSCVEELERCVKELGFVGVMINPDPEGGVGERTPGLRDEYWYPIYEKLIELDVPGVVHSCRSCSRRETSSVHFIVEETIAVASLLEGLGEHTDSHLPPSPKVFDDFPTIRLMVVHGGGAIPYQIGRFMARPYRSGGEKFEESIRRLYYDTCVYTKDALELLIKAVGPDRCMFGTENPGSGSSPDPRTGREMDDLAPIIESIEWLSADDKQRLFEDNARAFFKLKV